MGHVNAWVNSLNGGVDFASLHISANHILTQSQWYELLVMENIFDDNQMSVGIFRLIDSQFLSQTACCIADIGI